MSRRAGSDTLPSAAPNDEVVQLGGTMLGDRARWLAAVLYERGVPAEATKLDALRWVVRVAPRDARRAEPLVFAFAEGERFTTERVT